MLRPEERRQYELKEKKTATKRNNALFQIDGRPRVGHAWEKQKMEKSVDVACKYCAGDIKSWRDKLGGRKVWTCKVCNWTVHEKCKKKADASGPCVPDASTKLWQ